MAVTADGYVVQAFDFFAPGTNDATALSQIMDTPWFRSFFRRGDVFVVDRGFRDVCDRLEREGFRVYMPAFLQPGQKQLSDVEANNSHL